MTNRRQHAFSLIEILVVIGIIAIIVAILLPVLGAAKLAARMNACQTNLGMLGQASLNYAVDNDGTYIEGVGGSLQMVQRPGGDTRYREAWVGYLSNYTFEEGSPSMYCPFFEDDAFHSWPNGWNNYQDLTDRLPGRYWMGYANFVQPGNDVTGGVWRPLVSGPRLVDNTPSDMPILADIIEGNLDGDVDNWVHFSHTEGRVVSGGGLTSTLADSSEVVGPDGFNNTYADGSVAWVDYTPNPDDIEVAWSIPAFNSDSKGFMWHYDSRP